MTLPVASLPFALALTLASVPGAVLTAGRTDPPDEAMPPLQLGSLVRQELPIGATHRYRLPVGEGEFVRVTAEQRGVDVVVRLLGEDRRPLVEMDGPTGDRGREEVVWVADRAVELLVEVARIDSEGLGGAYEIALAERRTKTRDDPARLEAQTMFCEGIQLWARADDASFRVAAAKLMRAAELWHGVDGAYLEAVALYGAGVIAPLQDKREALGRLRGARELWHAQGRTAEEASALFSLAATERVLDEAVSALSHFQEALSLERSLGDLRHEAEILHGLGRLYQATGDLRKAKEHCLAALPLMVATRNLTGQVVTLSRVGSILEALGEKQKALDFFRQALALARLEGYARWEPFILRDVGRLYASLGETARALEALNESLAFYRSGGDRNLEGWTLLYLGRCYAQEGETSKALAIYREALPILRETGDRRTETSVLSAMSESLGTERRHQDALDALEEALCLTRVTGDPTQQGDVLSRVGATWAALGDYRRALENLLRALPIQEATANRPGQARTLFELARVERAGGDLASALAHARAAIDLAEDLRRELSTDDLRATFFGTIQKYYELVVDVLADLHAKEPGAGFDAQALRMSERQRARSLLDLLGEAGAEIRSSADPELAERERSLRRRIAASLAPAPDTGHPGANPAPAQKPADIELLRQEHREALERLHSSNPRYVALTRPEPLSLAEIQSQLGPEDLLLEYALGEERSYLWAVTATSLKSYALPSRASLEKSARRLYELLTARNRVIKSKPAGGRRPQIADAQFPEVAMALSQMLLAPVAADLGKKRLLIVGDGALQYIPFAVLPEPKSAAHDADDVPVVVKHEMVMLPSASVLPVLRRELAGRRPAPRTLAVLADPVFERDDERVKGAIAGLAKGGKPAAGIAKAEDPGAREAVLLRSAADVGMKNGEKLVISRLPFTRWEAAAILALVLPEERKEALDFDASLATATSPDLSNYRFVHFATHGFLDSVHPELSGLVLSLVDRGGKEQPGFLSAADIFNLNLPAELVVLSGCQTALGKEVKGEGLVGLTRAFMYAGAPRVVASLWKVDDAATSELMARFYKRMLGPEKVRPAAALREAQVSMWKEKRWKMPYYWAAFVLQGEWK